jgi:hypothetical protein
VPHVLGAFDSFTVIDAHANYRISEQFSASFGADNFTNEKYFLYHPSQRTYVASLSSASEASLDCGYRRSINMRHDVWVFAALSALATLGIAAHGINGMSTNNPLR